MTRRAVLLFVACLPLAAQSDHAPAAGKYTGFPFSTDETLRYSLNWPSGLSLGDATLSAHRTEKGWAFSASFSARIPGFAVDDKIHANAAGDDLCSVDFERDLSHGGKHTKDKTEFDQSQRVAHRTTVLPEGGGKSDLDTPSCARDALTFVYLARREMGQGRVAPAQQVYFGGAYSVRLQYTGEQTLAARAAGAKPAVTDRVVVYVKGPQSDFNFEIFFARDPQRTPLSIRIPLALGPVTLELAP